MTRPTSPARERCACCAGSGYDALAVDEDGGAVTCWACDGVGFDPWPPPEYARARAEGDEWAQHERRAFSDLRGELKTLAELTQRLEER